MINCHGALWEAQRSIIVPRQLKAYGGNFSHSIGERNQEKEGNLVLQSFAASRLRHSPLLSRNIKTKLNDSFHEMNLSHQLHRALQEFQIDTPSLIQQNAIETITARKSCLLAAPHGEGKTLAYLLPLYENMLTDREVYKIPLRERRPRTILLAPTRECIKQLQWVCDVLHKHTGLHAISFTSCKRANYHLSRLLKDSMADVVIMDPRLILRLLRTHRLFIEDLRYIAIDEADVMMSSQHDFAAAQLLMKVRKRNMYKYLWPVHTQIIFATAYITRKLEYCIGKTYPNLVKCLLPSRMHRPQESLSHKFIPITREAEKMSMLIYLLNKHGHVAQEVLTDEDEVAAASNVPVASTNNNISNKFGSLHGSLEEYKEWLRKQGLLPVEHGSKCDNKYSSNSSSSTISSSHNEDNKDDKQQRNKRSSISQIEGSNMNSNNNNNKSINNKDEKVNSDEEQMQEQQQQQQEKEQEEEKQQEEEQERKAKDNDGELSKTNVNVENRTGPVHTWNNSYCANADDNHNQHSSSTDYNHDFTTRAVIEHIKPIHWEHLSTVAAPFTCHVKRTTFAPGARTIVFARTIDAATAFYHHLKNAGFAVALLHASLPHQVRQRMFHAFASGSVNILCATDIASRGLDVHVDVIINMNMPTNALVYLSRSGRAARMGRSGICYSLYTKQQGVIVSAMKAFVHKNIPLEGLSNHKDAMMTPRYAEWRTHKTNALARAYVSLITRKTIPAHLEKTYIRHNATWRPIFHPKTVAIHGGVHPNQQYKIMDRVMHDAVWFRREQLAKRKGGRAKFGSALERRSVWNTVSGASFTEMRNVNQDAYPAGDSFGPPQRPPEEQEEESSK